MTNPIATITTATPTKTAQAFQFLLATEKGYTSTLAPLAGGGILLTASDGRAVAFTKETS